MNERSDRDDSGSRIEIYTSRSTCLIDILSFLLLLPLEIVIFMFLDRLENNLFIMFDI